MPEMPSRFDKTNIALRGIVQALTSAVNGAASVAQGLSWKDAGAPEEEPWPVAGEPADSPDKLLELIRGDFVDRSYLWSGLITPEIYADGCVYEDPTLRFEGLAQFQRNLRNLDPLIKRFVRDSSVTLYAIEAKEGGGLIEARWRMRGRITAPWRPILDVSGTTRFFFARQDADATFRVVMYKETWEEPVWRALGQLVTRGRD